MNKSYTWINAAGEDCILLFVYKLGIAIKYKNAIWTTFTNGLTIVVDNVVSKCDPISLTQNREIASHHNLTDTVIKPSMMNVSQKAKKGQEN